MDKKIIITDIRFSDEIDTTRRLYRNITNIVKRLEEHKASALTVLDIFTPTGEALRSKLRDYCERLIISNPVKCIPKMEELLWRKGFYDTISTAKYLRKENTWTDMEKAFLSTHLSVGVGFYHHLIMRLQLEFDLQLIVDFAYPNKKRSIHVEKSVGSPKIHSAEVKRCIERFIHRSLICLGDLTRYGLDFDITDPQIAQRYYKMAITLNEKYGMPHNQLGTMVGNKNYGLDAVYYYMRSLLCAEPFELAAGNLKRTIIANSLSSKENCKTQSCIARFLWLLQLWDNSLTNTIKINEESQALLSDIENCLNMEKSEIIDHEAAQNEDSIEKYFSHYKVEEITYLTDDMIFKIIIICFMKIYKLEQKNPKDIHGVVALVLAIFSQILQFVVLRLEESLLDISMSKVRVDIEANIAKEINKNKVINNSDTNDNIQNTQDNVSLSNDKNGKIEINGNQINGKVKKLHKKSKNLLTRLRRPRNRQNSSDSDASDGEGITAESSCEELNSDISENEENYMSDETVLSGETLSEDSSDDETDKNKNDGNVSDQTVPDKKLVEENENENVSTSPENEKPDMKETNEAILTCVALQEKQNLDPCKVLQVLRDEKMFTSIKVCCDWLQGHRDIIKTCTRGSKTLLKRLITLLNLINLDSKELLKIWNKDLEIFSSPEKVKEVIDIVPLPEDIDLRGVKFFESAHAKIDWEILKEKKITDSEETLLRALKVVKFGHYLCSIPELEIVFDNDSGLFVELNLNTPKTKPNEVGSNNLEIDQSKGKLMRHMGELWLKAEVKALENRLHHRLMSPYLVPDHEAFSRFIPVIKHLVYAKKFIVVIPTVVISALDEMKKTSGYAREATRWIEIQLQRGSRFLRVQRPHEKLPLPLIKSPKPKKKEAWLYFQIVECCYYLTQQNQSGDAEIPVVTLLTGINDRKAFTFSVDGLAKSAGVNFEHIGAFHAKWKLSIKSHG